MNGNNILVDTNVLIYFLEGIPSASRSITGKNLYTSVICEIELLSFKKLTSSKLATARGFLSFFDIIGLTPVIKEIAIILEDHIRSSYQMP